MGKGIDCGALLPGELLKLVVPGSYESELWVWDFFIEAEFMLMLLFACIRKPLLSYVT